MVIARLLLYCKGVKAQKLTFALCRSRPFVGEQIFDMLVEPKLLQCCRAGMLGSSYPSTAAISIKPRALTREGFMHIPFGAGVKEGQGVPSLQWSVVGNPDLEFAHVENQGWTA